MIEQYGFKLPGCGEKEGVEITGQIVIPSNMETKGSGGGGGQEVNILRFLQKGSRVEMFAKHAE